MMLKDEWIRSAMTDDRVVVELLVRLKQSQAAVLVKPQAVFPVTWGVRLPRSKPATLVSSLRCDIVSMRKEGDSSTRCSPTTPLSWSGGGGGAASPSGTTDGFEETTPYVSCSLPGVRSKVNGNVASGSANITKKSRRKKTFTELKEEECLLLKQQMHLKKELATLNATFNEQRARNENLKRIKIDLSFKCHGIEKASCSETHQREPTSLNQISSVHVNGYDKIESDSCETEETVSDHDRSSFLLPDLNMIPSDEDPQPETQPQIR